MKAQFKYGFITETDPDKAMARVKFEDDGILSPWLAISMPRTKGDQSYTLPDPGEHVWCMLDEYGDTGIIGGAIYSEADPPATPGEDIQWVTFSDGTVVKYDRAAHQLQVKVDTTELLINRDGFTVKRGSETLEKLISDLLAEILKITVTTPNGPSGTPINAAAFTAIKNRITTLLK